MISITIDTYNDLLEYRLPIEDLQKGKLYSLMVRIGSTTEETRHCQWLHYLEQPTRDYGFYLIHTI